MARNVLWSALAVRAFEVEVALATKNNGRVYISQRDAMEEMGCGHRDSIGRWFRELEFYGFIAKTAEGCLGVTAWQGTAMALD